MLRTVKDAVRKSAAGPYIRFAYNAVQLRDIKGPRYDLDTFAVMRRVLRPDSNCVDVGASNGVILERMIQYAPRGAHTAVEALPNLAAWLRQQYPGVEVHDVAVSDHEGTAEFRHVVNDPGYSGLQERVYKRDDIIVNRIPVRLERLDNVVKGRVDFLKVDIEGGEYHALRGAESLLRASKPVVVFEAGYRSTGQYGVSADDMHGYLTGLGYSLTLMRTWLRSGGREMLTPEGFRDHWNTESEFYFMAVPRAA